MPLNINIQQIVLHALNFVILFGALYFLLYKPVKSYMDGRRAQYEKMDAEAKEHLAQAEQTRAGYEEKLKGVETEIRDRREKAMQAVQQEADAARAQASAVMVRLLDPEKRSPVDLTDSNPFRLADAPNGMQPFMIWARENGYLINSNEPRGKLNKLLFGDENKTYFASAEEAAPYMRDVTVNVWQLQPDGTKTQGTLTLTVHKYLAADVYEIFQRIFEDEEKFPIVSVGGLRCTDKLRHAWGAAIDINPDWNCAAERENGAVKVTTGKGWWPLGSEKSEWAGSLTEASPYSIAAGGSVVKAFAAYGWGWGGSWQSSRDFMHFSVRTDGG